MHLYRGAVEVDDLLRLVPALSPHVAPDARVEMHDHVPRVAAHQAERALRERLGRVVRRALERLPAQPFDGVKAVEAERAEHPVLLAVAGDVQVPVVHEQRVRMDRERGAPVRALEVDHELLALEHSGEDRVDVVAAVAEDHRGFLRAVEHPRQVVGDVDVRADKGGFDLREDVSRSRGAKIFVLTRRCASAP
jgi:hypothetical protein